MCEIRRYWLIKFECLGKYTSISNLPHLESAEDVIVAILTHLPLRFVQSALELDSTLV